MRRGDEDRPHAGRSEDIDQIGGNARPEHRRPGQASVVVQFRATPQQSCAFILHPHQIEQGKAIIERLDQQIDIAVFISLVSCHRTKQKKVLDAQTVQIHLMLAKQFYGLVPLHPARLANGPGNVTMPGYIWCIEVVNAHFLSF